MNPGILHGECYGATRTELVANAQGIAAVYFEVPEMKVRVELDNETIDEVGYTQGGERMRARFSADFRAEVIS